MSQDASFQEAFQEKVQELAASLVLANTSDLSTFQGVFQALDSLSAHPEADPQTHCGRLLQRLRQQMESCVMGEVSLEEIMPQVEAELQQLLNPGSGTPESHPAQDSMEPSQPTSQPCDTAPDNGEESLADPELLREFLAEARENLDTIEVDLLALEEDPSNLEVIHRIFRPFHTIKGVSGFLNLQHIHRVAHRVEDVLDRARNGSLAMEHHVVDLVLEAVDLLKAMLNQVEKPPSTDALGDLSPRVEDFLERLAELDGDGDRPSAEDPPPLGQILVATQKVTHDDVAKALEIQQAASPETPLGEILKEQGKIRPKDVAQALKIQEAIVQVSEESKAGASAGTIRVDMAKLDNLVDMVGELVIAQSLIRQNPRVQEAMDHRLAKDFGHLGRITSELQRTAMSMRMVPIRVTFQKMIRLVRDLSRKSGKQVQLIMSGEETEIDRNMVDAIHDPLVHMIRNSVDHGIETPELREQRGKPAVGTIHLKAYHKGGHVIIEIQDDGGGLDRARILEKARQRGLIRPDETPSDHEIDQIIFQPGFSTAEKVTDVSGRGVGMDVVKKAIEKLRGRIELISQPEMGCTVVVKLPLTLAIIDGMIVRVGNERYIIPTMSIRETFQPSDGAVSTVHGKREVIMVRDKLMPLMRLHRIFSTPTARTRVSEALGIVVDNEGDCRCLLVDEVLGKQEVVIKSLGEGLRHLPGISGGAILGDGRVALILDVAGLLSMDESSSQANPQGEAAS
ncbi:MAG: chemotaxis protein CheA [Thermodesulfobacteriota bacterium]